MKDFIWHCAAPFFVFMAIACSIAFVVLYITDKEICDGYQGVVGIETKYSSLTCFVNSNGKFIPYKEYLARSVAHQE